MSIKIYIDYIRKVFREITKLSDKTGYSKIYHFLDYTSALLRHGCLIRQYTIGNFWRLSNAERSKRLTYPRMCKLMEKYNDNKYIHYLNNKKDFNLFFKEFIHRDWIDIKDSTFENFCRFIKNHSTIIIKPLDGVEGGGIRKYTYKGENTDNLKTIYNDLGHENVLVEECITQHPKMVFGNTSVNTIRTMTLIGKDGRGHVVKAILRAGVGDTVVDNYAMGGSIYEVDVKTGYVISYGKSKAGDLHIIHPQTNIVMLGYKIPHWNQVIEISEKAAEHLPQVGIIGWDVAISEDCVQLIEGNHNPDYELYEYIGSTGYYEKFKSLLS